MWGLTVTALLLLAGTAPGEIAACYADAECISEDPQSVCDVSGMVCVCKEGYYLAMPAEKCVNLDECAAGTHNCDVDDSVAGVEDGVCEDQLGSFICQCPAGHDYDPTNSGCHDVDECTLPGSDPRVHGCEQSCDNTYGGYTCTCDDGYNLHDDHISCVDIDECDSGERSTYNITDYRCTGGAVCENSPGTYMCSCAAGFEYLGSGTEEEPYRCDDIDECASGNGGCAGNCTNLNMADDGKKYECSCEGGLTLAEDGHACLDIPPCSIPGADRHTCDKGSTRAPGSDYPQTRALCRNLEDNYQCYCLDGWSYNQLANVCEDIDECSVNAPCMQLCDNTYGGYECACRAGFELMADKNSCRDVDECADGERGCQHVCTNTYGTYTCTCHPGYMLDRDKQHCTQGRVLDVELCLNLAHTDDFTDLSSESSSNLVKDVETNMLAFLKAANETSHEYEYYAVRVFPCSGPQEAAAPQAVDSPTGVQVMIVPDADVTDEELAVFAARVSDVITGAEFSIDGQKVALLNPPQFVFPEKDDNATFSVSDPCDYLNMRGYCQNGALCQDLEDGPQCRCVGNYAGPQCVEEVDDSLTHVEIGMFAGFAGLALMFVLLGACVIILMRRMSKQQQQPYYPSDQYQDQYPEQYQDQYQKQYQDQYQNQYQDQYQNQYQDQYQNQYQDQYQKQYQDQYQKQLYPYTGQLALKY